MNQILIILFSVLITTCKAVPLLMPKVESYDEGHTKALTYKLILVKDIAGLKKALVEARPGDSIVIAPGNYEGKYVLSESGTEKKPIVITGTDTETVLGAGSHNSGYVFYLKGSYCKIKNLTIQNGLKGIIVEGASNNSLENLTVKNIGEEAIHLRSFSSNNLISECNITNTGINRPGYGEGIYIGTAYSQWSKFSNGKPDKCDNNIVAHNKIGPNVRAECIDIKEGTTGGIIVKNEFYAEGISGENYADSWLDVKGNHYLIEDNKGFNDGGNPGFTDGVQVNCAYEGWGNNNVFRRNWLQVNASGYGINVRLKSSQGEAVGNMVYDSNTQEGAAKGLTNITVSK